MPGAALPRLLSAAVFCVFFVGVSDSAAGGSDVPACAGRPATIVGHPGEHAKIEGTAGPDVVVALAETNTILAYGGDDVICGSTGDDRISAGAGDDQVYGGDGNDTIGGGPGDDTVDGGGGDDRIGIGKDRSTVYGGDGNDTITARTKDSIHASKIDGGPGDDTILIARNGSTVHGGDGNDRIDAERSLMPSSGDFLYGDAGNDVITERLSHVDDGSQSGYVDGGAGNDVIQVYASTEWNLKHGRAADTPLHGGPGDDTIVADSYPFARGAKLRAYGDDGNDTLSGAGGFEFGGAGDDHLLGSGRLDGGPQDGADTCSPRSTSRTDCETLTPGGVDLVVDVQRTPAQVHRGDVVTFAVTVHDVGSDAAQVSVGHFLGGGSIRPPALCQFHPGSCRFTLAGGGSRTLTFTGTAFRAGTFTFVATAVGQYEDLDPADDGAQDQGVVLP
jgi:Ca2+-binding RTX toxin-like protein